MSAWKFGAMDGIFCVFRIANWCGHGIYKWPATHGLSVKMVTAARGCSEKIRMRFQICIFNLGPSRRDWRCCFVRSKWYKQG